MELILADEEKKSNVAGAYFGGFLVKGIFDGLPSETVLNENPVRKAVLHFNVMLLFVVHTQLEVAVIVCKTAISLQLIINY